MAGHLGRWLTDVDSQTAIPRLVLALLLGSIISTPIVLRIFQSGINGQITVIKRNVLVPSVLTK